MLVIATYDKEVRLEGLNLADAEPQDLYVAGDGAGSDDGAWLLVRGPDATHVLAGVRDAACSAGVGLHELRPAGPTLEESLIGAIG